MSLASRCARMALRTTMLALVGGFGATTAQAAVDPTSADSVRDAYAATILAAGDVDPGWTGSTDGCRPGTESATSAAASIASVNFFREMNRLAPVTLAGAAVNAKAQAAALMFEANNNVSHTPGSNWACYTAGGAEAAGRSNIALGIAGARTVQAYVEDAGAYNDAVGHRRWILYPRARVFGSGSTNRANALWVVSDTEGSRPAQDVVAWPPKGFVPWPLVYDKWSVSSNLAPQADYSAARVSVTANGTRLTVKQLPVHEGYADNAIVFQPEIPASMRTTESEVAFDVSVSNVLVRGVARTLSYRTTAIGVDTSDAPTDVTATVSDSSATITWQAPGAPSSEVTGYRLSIVDAAGRTVAARQLTPDVTQTMVDELTDANYRAEVRTLLAAGQTPPAARMFTVGTPRPMTIGAGPIRRVRVLRTGMRTRVLRLSLREHAAVSTLVQRWSTTGQRWTKARRVTRRGLHAGLASMRIGRLRAGRYRALVVSPRTATRRASRVAVRFRVR